MGFQLTARDRQRLAGVNPALVRVIERAATITDLRFTVLEGLRTLETQRQYVAKGASKTMKSRHLTGHAVDLAPMLDLDRDGTIETSEMFHWPLFYQLAPIVKQAAALEGVTLEWGGDWKSFRDGPHWQLPWASYP